jgi:hypothetical protein
MTNLFQKIGLIPRYTEVSLFLTALTFTLIYAANNEAPRAVTGLATISPAAFLLFIVFLLGLIFSVYYALSDKETPGFAKVCMLMFVILANFGAALFAFASISREANGYYLIFPALNLINAVMLLLMFRGGMVNEECVSNENAKPIDLFIGTASVFVLFLISQYILKNYWAITFSVCLSYSSAINDAVTKTLFGEIKLTEKRKKKKNR